MSKFKIHRFFCFLFYIFFFQGWGWGSRTETRCLFLKEVQDTWQTPSHTQANIAQDPPSQKKEGVPFDLKTHVQHLIIPKLSIDNLPFGQALKVLTEVVRLYDISELNINFVLLDPEHHAPNVDLNIQALSLDKIIHYLGEMTQFIPVYDGTTIVFRDSTLKANLQTQIFPVARGSVLQILSYTSHQESKNSEEERLKNFFEKIGILFEQKGTGFAYDGQNFVVTHTPDCLQQIKEVLSRYRQQNQIAIEAKFLEVQQGVLEEIGIKWNSGSNNHVAVQTQNGLRSISQLQTNTLAKSTDDVVASNVPTFPNALNFGTSVGDLINANTILNRYQMNVLLKAIEQRTDADLMSAPKVTVLSGRKAEIVVAQELRYPESYRDGRAEVGQSSTNGTSASAGTALIAGVPEKFVTRNIGVEMAVTPLAENKTHIHLCLEPCVTEFEGFVQYGGNNVVTYGGNSKSYESGYYQPVFSTRKIKTEVSLRNGSTLVMGGLTREEVKETHDKIPFFSNIPLLGKLFTSKGQASQKKNLLIFVTANLVDENGNYAQNSELEIPKLL